MKITVLGNNIITAIQALFATVAFILLCIPVFSMTGSIVKPLFITVVGSIIICIGMSFSKNKWFVSGVSQLCLMLFWLLVTLVKEFELQISVDWEPYWIDFFYFDKLLMLGTVWLVNALFFSVNKLLVPNDKSKIYFKYSGTAFLLFYSFLLIYSFVLIRLERGEYPMNLQIFSTVNTYISDYSSIPYEVFMMFFGNLLYFTPMGYIFYNFLRLKKLTLKVVVIFVFPLVAFSLLELSQYLLQNGYCEIDDMLMNSAGFWLGAAFGMLTDKLAVKISRGKHNVFWG